MGKTGRRKTRRPFRNRARDDTGCVTAEHALYTGTGTERYSGRLPCRTPLVSLYECA